MLPAGASHGLQDELALIEKVPTSQAPQVAFEDAPVFGECLPAGHSEHTDAAVSAAYRPAWQSAHAAAPAAAEIVPAPQSVHVDAPSAPDTVPGWHSEHTDAAVSAAYRPALHGTLSLAPPTQKCPTGHTAPAADDDPAAQ